MAAAMQRVHIARYGLRECALVEFKGPFDMDIAADGVRAAEELAERLRNTGLKRIYCSPFLRAVHTAHVVAECLELPLCVEMGLTEWLTPSLVGETMYTPATTVDLAARFPRIDTTYESLVDPTDAFPESETALLARMADVGAKLSDAAWPDDILCVSHAPCNLALALALEGKTASPETSSIKPWPLGGVSTFARAERSASSEWTCEASGDTSHLSGEERGGIQAWTLPCLTTTGSATAGGAGAPAE